MTSITLLSVVMEFAHHLNYLLLSSLDRSGDTKEVSDLGLDTPPKLPPLLKGFLPSKDFSWLRQKGQDIVLSAILSSKRLSKFY